MGRRLSGLLLILLAAARLEGQEFDFLLRAPSVLEQVSQLPAPPAATFQSLCPLEDRSVPIPLPAESYYWSSDLVIELDGARVHVSGNKDQGEGPYQGIFLGFLVEGSTAPVWVLVDLRGTSFQLNGKTYMLHPELGLWGMARALLNPEGIRLKVSGARGTRAEFTVEDLGRKVLERMPRVVLGDQTFYAVYTRKLKESGKKATFPTEEHWLVLTGERWSSGRAHFDSRIVIPEDLATKSIAVVPREPKNTRSGPGWGLHLEHGVLEVFDLRGLSQEEVLACFPAAQTKPAY